MSYRIPSRKAVAEFALAGSWNGEDVVVAGTDGDGHVLRISRTQASVPASLVRRWLLVRDGHGRPRLKVVRDFVSGDGYLFTV